jgi:hypothetical protein
MNVFRHHDVSEHAQLVRAPDALQRGFESLDGLRRVQQGAAVITAERDEMGLPGFVKAP